MDFLLGALREAFRLLTSADPDLWSAVRISLTVSVTAILLSASLCAPLAWVLVNGRFPGRRVLLSVFQTLMAVPTVVVGLFTFTLLSRQGPLGTLDLLFTPTAMTLAETFLVIPLMVSLAASAFAQIDARFGEEAWSLGVRGPRRLALMLNEARGALAVAVFTGLGRAISEVGCAMMVGGNIRGITRNITTTIALETSKGEFALGLALGVVLLAVALLLNVAVRLVARGGGGSAWKSS